MTLRLLFTILFLMLEACRSKVDVRVRDVEVPPYPAVCAEYVEKNLMAEETDRNLKRTISLGSIPLSMPVVLKLI